MGPFSSLDPSERNGDNEDERRSSGLEKDVTDSGPTDMHGLADAVVSVTTISRR